MILEKFSTSMGFKPYWGSLHNCKKKCIHTCNCEDHSLTWYWHWYCSTRPRCFRSHKVETRKENQSTVRVSDWKFKHWSRSDAQSSFLAQNRGLQRFVRRKSETRATKHWPPVHGLPKWTTLKLTVTSKNTISNEYYWKNWIDYKIILSLHIPCLFSCAWWHAAKSKNCIGFTSLSIHDVISHHNNNIIES